MGRPEVDVGQLVVRVNGDGRFVARDGGIEFSLLEMQITEIGERRSVTAGADDGRLEVFARGLAAR